MSLSLVGLTATVYQKLIAQYGKRTTPEQLMDGSITRRKFWGQQKDVDIFYW